MKEEDKEKVMTTVDNEGFDYCFCDYSDFDEIEDVEFHELRKKYKDVAEKLKKLIDYYEW